jgi:uncharacterized protein (UPF0335 family)/DNA modification methylase
VTVRGGASPSTDLPRGYWRWEPADEQLLLERAKARATRQSRASSGAHRPASTIAFVCSRTRQPEGSAKNQGTVAADQLRLFIERIERLEEEKKGIADDIRDVYAEAKANGYDPKIMRLMIRLRKMETHTRQEQVAVAETFGDVRDKLAELEPESVDCVVTSPPYWGLRDYGVDGQIGMEPTLGEHLSVMVEVFDLVRRAMKPEATLWLNYGDCYATKPNGRSAEATKAAGNDDRTFRDKPFSTVGPIYGHLDREYEKTPRAGVECRTWATWARSQGPRVVGVGMLKPKDLCMIPNRLAIALQDAGWWVRSEIVWGKPNPMPDSSGRYRPSTAHEKIWLLSKSAKCFYDSEAVRMPAARITIERWSQDVEGAWQRPRECWRQDERHDESRRRASLRQAHWREPRGLRRPSESIGHQAAHGRARCRAHSRRRPLAPQLRARPVADHHARSVVDRHRRVQRGAFRDLPARAGDAVHPRRLSRRRHGARPVLRRRHHRPRRRSPGRNCIGIELNPEYAEIARAYGILAEVSRLAALYAYASLPIAELSELRHRLGMLTTCASGLEGFAFRLAYPGGTNEGG